MSEKISLDSSVFRYNFLSEIDVKKYMYFYD